MFKILLLAHSSVTDSDCQFLLRIPLTSQWYMQNGLQQLNPDKSEAVVIRTAKQLQSTHVQSVNVAGVDLPVAEEMKVLGVALDWRLTFDKHASAVARPCNYHAQAIRYIRHMSC